MLRPSVTLLKGPLIFRWKEKERRDGFFAALTEAFPFFTQNMLHTHAYLVGTKKASLLHRSGRQGKDLPKKQMRARQRSRIYFAPRKGRRIAQKTVSLSFPRARRQMNGRKYDDRLLLAAARLSHRSGKNFFFSLSRFTFPLFPLALPTLSSSLLFP